MPNKTFVGDDGIIYGIYEGVQDEVSIRSIIDQTWALVDEKHQHKKPVLVLADVQNVTRVTLSGRRSASKALTQWQYDKIAVCGASTYMHHLANLVVTATNHSHKVRMFRNEADAKKWLLEPVHHGK